MATKIVYAYNQEEAKQQVRSKKYVPIKAKFAGTKHNMRVYMVWYRMRKRAQSAGSRY